MPAITAELGCFALAAVGDGGIAMNRMGDMIDQIPTTGGDPVVGRLGSYVQKGISSSSNGAGSPSGACDGLSESGLGLVRPNFLASR